jgi:hypothetical protein
MKGSFFEQFKKYLLNEHKDQLEMFIPYFETTLQVKDKLSEILEDAEKYYMEIRYENDKQDGYTNGELEFHFFTKNPDEDYAWDSSIGHYYKMELLEDPRHWGYCDCDPKMELYDPIHNCCGNGCDWYAPRIDISKISEVAYHSFDGVERDLWQLERKWKDDKTDYEEEMRKARLKRIEDEIRRLEEEKTQL